MKRKRADSSNDPPRRQAKRSTRSSSDNSHFEISKTSQKAPTGKRSRDLGSDGEALRTVPKQKLSTRAQTIRRSKPADSDNLAEDALESHTRLNDPVSVVITVRKTRGVACAPTKSASSDNRSPMKNGLSHSIQDRVLTPVKKRNVQDGVTPVKRIAREIAEEIRDGEESRIITRGMLRDRLDRELADGQSEDEEESDDDDEDEDNDEYEVTHETATMTASYENFFSYSAKRKKSQTSNNTLSLLPALTPQESTSLLASISDHHSEHIKRLHDAHRAQFTQWKFEIDLGYNIALCGYGSKRSIIEEFGREKLAQEMCVLAINGYYPSLSLDVVLSQILEHIAPNTPSTGDKLGLIQSSLNEPLAILIHSLDSPILRLPKNQQILSLLASNKYITIVASVDHVNAPLLFDSLKLSRYNFLWHDCTTFVPYRTELSFEVTTFLSGSSSATASVGGLAGIKAVLNNLQPNARKLYLLLLRHQLPLHPENNDPAGQEQGVTFPQLRQLISKKILPLANPTTLRNLLVEFYDHGLLVRNDGKGSATGKRGKGGGEILWAPFGKLVVSEVIEYLDGQVGD